VNQELAEGQFSWLTFYGNCGSSAPRETPKSMTRKHDSGVRVGRRVGNFLGYVSTDIADHLLLETRKRNSAVRVGRRVGNFLG